MKNLLSLGLLLLVGVNLQATSVNASAYGFNANDATTAFQAAIYAPFDTVVVDLQAADWMVQPNTFFELMDKTIIFEQGVVMRAIPGTFAPIYSSLLRFVNASNLTIIGYGAELFMDRSEYAELDDSEYRHSLNFFNCNGLTVKGLTIRGSGGDGIYIGGETGGGNQGYSSNLLIEDVRCLDHYRQGMSVVSAQNLTVRHCLFSGTEGALPEAGVDIEPFETYQRVVDVLFENCSFMNNGWSGMAVALFDLDGTSLPVSITVRDCYFRDNCRPENSYALSEIHASADDFNPVQGELVFERCFIDGSDYGAFYTRKTAAAFGITFDNCVFRDVSRLQTEFNEPIFLEVPNYDLPSPALGGLHFREVLVSYSTNFDFFRVYGWSTLEGLAEVSGSFVLVEPFGNGVVYSNVADTSNVAINFTTQTSLPSTDIVGSVLASTAVECDSTKAVYALTRTSTLTDYPMGLSLTANGTGTDGNDLHLFPRGWIIPANVATIEKDFAARNDGLSETNESFVISVMDNGLYTSTDSELAFTLLDCLPTSLDQSLRTNKTRVFPNPFTNHIYIDLPETELCSIEIYSSDGSWVKTVPSSSGLTQINLESIPAGIYLIRVISPNGNVLYKGKIVQM